jgi:hypothetical protein
MRIAARYDDEVQMIFGIGIDRLDGSIRCEQMPWSVVRRPRVRDGNLCIKWNSEKLPL